MLLRSYSENRNKKFQIQGGGMCPPPPVSAPEEIRWFDKCLIDMQMSKR